MAFRSWPICQNQVTKWLQGGNSYHWVCHVGTIAMDLEAIWVTSVYTLVNGEPPVCVGYSHWMRWVYFNLCDRIKGDRSVCR